MKLHDLAIQEEALEGEIHLIALRGEVDRASAPGLERRMVAAVDAGKRGVVLDLTLVRDIDRRMLTALLSGARHLAHHDARLALVCAQPGLRRILRITGLDGVIDVTASRAAAMRAVTPDRLGAGPPPG